MNLSVREFTPDEWPLYRELRLRALRDAPDAFGSTHAHEAEREEEDWKSRLARGATSAHDLPLVAEVDRQPVGLAWARIDALDQTVAHLFQVWVAPTHRHLGVAHALLHAAIAWARAAHAQRLVLDVTCGNTPAERMYRRAGFVSMGDPQPLRPGSALLSQSMQLELDRNP